MYKKIKKKPTKIIVVPHYVGTEKDTKVFKKIIEEKVQNMTETKSSILRNLMSFIQEFQEVRQQAELKCKILDFIFI